MFEDNDFPSPPARTTLEHIRDRVMGFLEAKGFRRLNDEDVITPARRVFTLRVQRDPESIRVYTAHEGIIHYMTSSGRLVPRLYSLVPRREENMDAAAIHRMAANLMRRVDIALNCGLCFDAGVPQGLGPACGSCRNELRCLVELKETP